MREESNLTQGRLAFLLPSMEGGGAERLTIELMRGSLQRGHGVDLVLARRDGEWLASVPDGVRTIGLGTSRLRGLYHEVVPGLVIFGRLVGRSFSAQALIALFNTLLTTI